MSPYQYNVPGRLLSPGEVARLTSVISTAEYCRETVLHLQDKLREKLQPALRSRADLQPEVDMFSATIDTCVQLLAQVSILVMYFKKFTRVSIDWY